MPWSYVHRVSCRWPQRLHLLRWDLQKVSQRLARKNGCCQGSTIGWIRDKIGRKRREVQRRSQINRIKFKNGRRWRWWWRQMHLTNVRKSRVVYVWLIIYDTYNSKFTYHHSYFWAKSSKKSASRYTASSGIGENKEALSPPIARCPLKSWSLFLSP